MTLPIRPPSRPVSYNPETHWQTNDGRIIPIKEMTDDHLVNCARLIESKHKKFVDDCSTYYPCFQGEMAQMQAEQDWGMLMMSGPEDIHRSYTFILMELKIRGVPLL